MFEVRDDIGYIHTGPESVVAIIESINSPMVAAANKPLEAANAFIVGVRNSSGLFSIYIYLHLLQSKECMIYLHEPPEIPIEAYHETEVEALQFVESMGFMVDNLNFRKLAPEQQSALMERLPVFHQDLEAFARRAESAAGEDMDQEAAENFSKLAPQVIELDKEEQAQVARRAQGEATVSREGLAKIVRLFSSF